MKWRHHRSVCSPLVASAVMLAVAPAISADVTPERLANPEPGNWLMNHCTYDGQRFSPLARINRDSVKGLKLAYAVPLGAGNEFNEATALAEDGFLYITDFWGIVYKIDGRSGEMGRIVWRMDPKQERISDRSLSNRGAAFWGSFVISAANFPPRIVATDKKACKVAWETNVADGQVDLQLTAAPLAVKDKIIAGAARGDRGVRDWIAWWPRIER